mmetsp:Transcript_22278/g.45826  ORF Transcript_22278/g.45826 Transcript_22278/m.45826 type:complete len:86 (-) Transcript_22278:197-454(-)
MPFSKHVLFVARNSVLNLAHQQQRIAPTAETKNAPTVLPSSVVPIVNLYYIVDETAKDLIGNMVATRLSARRQRLSGSRLHSINH